METVGSQKMPRCKGILLSLWKVRDLRRFLHKMQQMTAGSWVKAICSIFVNNAGFQKMPLNIVIKVILFHCGKCGLSEDSFMKCKQISMQNWVKDFCSISVETASSREKKCLGVKWCFYVSLWKVRVLRRFLDKKCNKLLREVG